MHVAVIVPARDEEEQIVATLAAAGCVARDPGAARPGTQAAGTEAPARAGAISWVVVDGGSRDRTAERARDAGATVLVTAPGRALQMNAGAAAARDAGVLLFLHADTRLPADWLAQIEAALAGGVDAPAWGRFDVRLDPETPLLRLVAAAMNLRSRLSGIATGDQAIFVTRRAWEEVGGYPPIALMEDVEISRRLKRSAGAPACLRAQVRTSSRRWLTQGVLRTIARMWLYRALYFCGVPAAALHRRYYGGAKPGTPPRPGHEA